MAEQMAREMLADNPALASEFKARLASDKAFAADPKERLEFFYRRHPSWDDHYHLVPVFRSD